MKYYRVEHKKILAEAQNNIVYLKAKSNYTNIFLLDGPNKIMAYNLAIYSEILPNSFLRVSRSCIINLAFIKQINFQNKMITLSTGNEIQISKRKWKLIKADMKHFNLNQF